MAIATPFLFLGLLPVSGIDTDDRENLSEVYIGFSYSPPVATPAIAARSRIRQGFGVGF
jgi:hypothetical protein